MQPGQTIHPQGAAPVPSPSEPPAGGSPVQETPPSPQAPTTAENTWAYQKDIQEQPAQNNNGLLVSWSASEFVAHSKGPSWFMGLGFVVAVLGIGIFLFTHDLVSPIMIAVLGIAFGVFAARQPRVLEYGIGQNGLAIGHKFYPYEAFKSFAIIEDGPFHAILLTPLQRFMPPLNIYYEESDEDHIVDTLADYLPFSEAKLDTVDSLMRRVRF